MTKPKFTKADVEVLPFSEEAEEALLGCILIQPDILSDVQSIIKGSGDFYIELNGMAYKVLCKMATQGMALDIVTVSEFLDSRVKHHASLPVDQLERGQMDRRLTRYMNAVPTALNWHTYARIVRRNAIQRICMKTYLRALELVACNGLDLGEMIDKTITMLESYREELSNGT